MKQTPRTGYPPNKILQQRLSGVLLHLTSLPGGHGIGDIGSSAHEFIDFLAEAKQRVWQVLPTGPTIEEEFHSPYSCISAFAGNPLLISLDALVHAGLLTRKDVSKQLQETPLLEDSHKVHFKHVLRFKTPLLRRAAANFTGESADTALARFRDKHSWIEEYSQFSALREYFGCSRNNWPVHIRTKPQHSLDAVHEYVSEADTRLHTILQVIFYNQWGALRHYAHTKGVYLFGDVPIYVSNDSADVWGNPELFELDKNTGRPSSVSGVPPDLFSAHGQLWGHPIYDWRNLKKMGFSWWIKRFGMAEETFDIVRVDHFRGLESYWAIPADAATAATGCWRACPGYEMLQAVETALGGLPLFVEDLGLITPEVHALRDRFNLAGTRVLQFAFDGDPSHATNSIHHPMNTPHHSAIYTGTHDNAPVAEWFAELPAANRAKIQEMLNDCSPSKVPEQFVRLAMSLPAKLCILLMQDLLGLGRGHRMNHPGTASWSNWTWRFERIPKGTATHLAHLSEIFERNA
jgi:4-alpha-glucanotransferase